VTPTARRLFRDPITHENVVLADRTQPLILGDDIAM